MKDKVQGEKSLYADEWMDEKLSSNDEEVEDKSYMAHMEEEKTINQFDIDMKEIERMRGQPSQNKASANKVYNFHINHNKEKWLMFKYLYMAFDTSL